MKIPAEMDDLVIKMKFICNLLIEFVELTDFAIENS